MSPRSAAARGLCSVLLLALLGGCATYRARPLHPAADAAALTGRSLSDPRLLRFIAIEEHRAGPVRWNLQSLTLAAVYERPEMKIAAARVGAAKAGEVTAAALPNPRLSLSPTYNATTLTPSPWKVGPVVAFLIQAVGVRPALMARARAQAEAARQALAVTAWQLRGTVRTALLNLWAARRSLVLARRNVALAQSYEQVLRQRYRAGSASAAALNLARLAENQAALRLAAVRRRARLANAGMAAALGLPRRALDGVALDMAGLDHPRQPGDLAPLIHAALTARPDLRAALDRYQAAEAGLRVAIARQYPSFDIGPGYHYDQGDNKFILALSLPLPIFNQNQGPIAAARAARRLAAERFMAAQERVLDEIDRAVTDWHASKTEAETARNLLAAARNTVVRQHEAFQAGAIGRLRLIGAELALVQTEQGALAAATDERGALGALESALYHPFLVADQNR
ncbi:MAG: TolC family protein [Proteobacteria bacterium]|nr:TolC family protein [Pseudomonadota bacterium]